MCSETENWVKLQLRFLKTRFLKQAPVLNSLGAELENVALVDH